MFIRHLKARPQLFVCFLLGAIVFFVVPLGEDRAARWLLAWDLAVAAYLIMAGYAMAGATGKTMQKRAEVVDEGRYGYLVMTIAAAAASLAAIVIELVKIKGDGDNPNAIFYVCVSLATIVLSWAFIQIVFTEHYAHEYYMQGRGARRVPNEAGSGLAFLGAATPNYLDFLYFTVTIGVANQTADIAVVSRQMRLLVMIQSVISYFVNTAVLALSFNILSNSIQ